MRRIQFRAYDGGRFDRLRLHLIGYALRLALLLGYTVVLIGDMRSGKSQILTTLTPGRILDGWQKRNGNAQAYDLHIDELPRSPFSFDEVQNYERLSLEEAVTHLGKCKRPFAVAMDNIVTERIGVELFMRWTLAQGKPLRDTKLLQVSLLSARDRRIARPVDLHPRNYW